MSNIRKILASAMTVLIILSTIPIQVFALNNATNTDNSIIFEIEDNEGSVIIPVNPSLSISTDSAGTNCISGSTSVSENEITFIPDAGLNNKETYYYTLEMDYYETITGSFNGSDSSVKIYVNKKEKLSIDPLKTTNINMTYGDNAVTLTDYITLPDGYNGKLSYSVTSGSDVVSIDNGKASALKSGKAVIHVVAEETEDYNEATGDITVAVSKKNLGTLTKDDLSFKSIKENYSGNTTWNATGFVNTAILKSGDSLSVTATATTDSANIGTYSATVSNICLKSNDKYTAVFNEDEMTTDVTITSYPVDIIVDNINIEYASSDWYKIKKGELESYLTEEKIQSLLSAKSEISKELLPEVITSLEAAADISVDTSSLNESGYSVGTYNDLINITFDKNKSGNFYFSTSSKPSISITTESTSDDKKLWEKIEIDEKSDNGVYIDDDTIYLAKDGYVTFKVKDSENDKYDSVAIKINKDYSNKVTGKSTSGALTGTFYLYNSKHPQTRTDADPEKAGAQDNVIPTGAIYTDNDAPKVKINDKELEALSDEKISDIEFETVSNIPSMIGKYEDNDSGVDEALYSVLAYKEKDSDNTKTLKEMAESLAKTSWKSSSELDLSNLKCDGYYIILTKIQDRVGNTIYNAYGIAKDTLAPEVTVNGIENNGIYNNNVDYTVSITDISDTAVSGLSEIRVTVSADGKEIPVSAGDSHINSFVLTKEDIEELEGEYPVNPDTKKNLGKALKLSGTISKELNTSDINVIITAKDRAGNETVKNYDINIDTDAPKVEVSYNNNDVRNDIYFKNTRTAYVKITERSFDESKVKFNINVDNKKDSYSVDDLKNGKVKDVILMNTKTKNNVITYQVCFGSENTDSSFDWDISVTDKAGNTSESVEYAQGTAAGKSFVIDRVPVSAELIFTTVDGKNISLSDKNVYLNQNVNASITLKETNFDITGTEVTVTQTDGAGNAISVYDTATLIEILTDKQLENGIDGTYSLPQFTKDANYCISIKLTDKAGNVTEISNKRFTIDTTAPTGSIIVQSEDASGNYIGRNTSAIFSYITNHPVSVNVKSDDETSGVSSVQYYLYIPKENESGTFSIPDPSSIADSAWSTWLGQLSLNSEGQSIVYLKITDKAGNICYMNANEGIIVDTTAPQTPQITLAAGNEDTIYDSDVPFTLSVTDPTSGGTYAGLKSVTYEVLNDGVVTQSETHVFSDKTSRTKSATYSSAVSATKNNSNHITIRVTAVDYAGNTSTAEKNIKIDITAPRIEITYDNTTKNGYYNSTRTATVHVYERNFDPSGFTLSLQSILGKNGQIGNWSLASNMGESDDALSTVTISFSADDTYMLTASVKDLAGNTATLGRTDTFTIDKTLPIVQITFDKNNALNGSYYNTARTATITVTDRNFDKNAFVMNMKASLAGENIDTPSISGWSDNGDVHKATLTFSKDGTYQFSCNASDLAGNKSETENIAQFTIDKTAPEMKFTGVEDNNAYNSSIHPVVEYSDLNASASDQVIITLVGERHEKKILTGTYESMTNGGKIILEDFDKIRSEDDVYTMTAAFTDLAGNRTEKSITFSVNRFGSNFTFDDNTKELLNRYYIQGGEDIVVRETNVNSLTHKKITVGFNGTTTTLKENDDYTINEDTDNGWKMYTYAIKAKNFTDEGLYEIIITSTDAAGNTQDTKLKDSPISFIIDHTSPTAIITGVENNGRYNVAEKSVQINLTDNYALDKAEIYVDGNIIDELDANEIEEINGLYTLTVKDSSSFQNIAAKVYDAAGNEADSDVVRILVTSNMLTQYFYNKPLFYGSLVAIAAVIWGLYLLLTKKINKNQ